MVYRTTYQRNLGYRVTGIWQKDEVEEAKKYGQAPGDPKVANNYTADDIVNADGSVKAVYNDKDKEFLGQTTPPVHWSMRNDLNLRKTSVYRSIYILIWDTKPVGKLS
jgi:hypothetical protein